MSELYAIDKCINEFEFRNFVAWIFDWDAKFDTIAWRNPARARQLVNSGLSLISNSVSDSRVYEKVLSEISGHDV